MKYKLVEKKEPWAEKSTLQRNEISGTSKLVRKGENNTYNVFPQSKLMFICCIEIYLLCT